MWEKEKVWNPSTCPCENGKYLESIIDDSVVICDKIKEVTKTVPIKAITKKTFPTNFNIEKITCKIENRKFIYFTHHFLITVSLLAIISIYYCIIRHWPK